MVRAGPDAVRSARNDTGDGTYTWVVVGAPSVGTAEFGNTVLPDGERL